MEICVGAKKTVFWGVLAAVTIVHVFWDMQKISITWKFL
jgi:hypothetical protein